MASKRWVVVGGMAVAAVAIATYLSVRTPSSVTLTGIVTTDDIVVSPQVAGQISQLLVKEGDSVHQGQILAVLASGELAADRAFFARSEEGSAQQVQESEAALRYQEQETADQIHQADATLGGAVAQRDEAVANVANAKSNPRPRRSDAAGRRHLAAGGGSGAYRLRRRKVACRCTRQADRGRCGRPCRSRDRPRSRWQCAGAGSRTRARNTRPRWRRRPKRASASGTPTCMRR